MNDETLQQIMGEGTICEFCDNYCKFPNIFKKIQEDNPDVDTSDWMNNSVCEDCPLTILADLIYKEGDRNA